MKKTFSKSSANVTKIEKGINAKQWLSEHYPRKQRIDIKKLDIIGEGLEGDLDLSDFINLEVLDCTYNQLTSINLNNCKKLKILFGGRNKLASLDLTNSRELKDVRCLW